MSIESLARPEIVAMKAYSSARKEAPGRGILLNANEAPHGLLDPPLRGLGLNRYPDPQPGDLLERLAELYSVGADNLLVTRGSDEGIDLLTRVFCRAGEDAILQCPPNFGMYRIAAQTQGAHVVSVPRPSEDDFRLNTEGVLHAVRNDPRIRLVFLTSPNNPTGDLVERDFVESLLRQCRGQALVVMDEAYAEFSPEPSLAEWIPQHENLVVLRTLSKAWAGAGLRCGTVLAQAPVIGLLRRIIAPYPLPSPVVGLALAMLEPGMMDRQAKLLEEVREQKQRLVKLLTNRSFVDRLFPGEANFVLFSTADAEGLLSFCAARNIILRGFPSDPDLRNCVRISVGTAEELDALEQALNEWEKTP